MKNQTEESPCKNPILKHKSQIRTHEKLYPILDVSLDLLCSIDRHGHFVSVNNAAERILGYTREELTGMNYCNIIHSEDRYKTGAIANEIISGRKVNDFENRYVRKDGSIVDLRWAATWNEEDQLLYCVARDISELKKAQEALLKSNERFYYATKATSDAVWEWDLKTNQLLWGENYYSLFGYHPESENNHISNWYVREHPSDCERVVKSINSAIETGVEIWTEEYRYKKADGCYVWVLNKGIILKDATGQVLKMIGAMQDISSRKLYEERLILNERRFRSLVQDSSEITAIINIDGDYEYVSPSVKNVLGFTPEYFIGKNAFQFIHPDDVETTVLSLKSIYDSDAVTLEPFRFQNAQGQWRWIETKLSNQIKNPSIQGIIANSRDITDQRNIQEELRTLALLAKQTNNAVLLTDVERRIIWVNEAFLKLYKYRWEQIIGQDPQDLLKGAETSETEIGKIRESVKNSSPYQTEIILYSRNKEKRFVELQIQPVFNEKGQLVNYFCIHHDITERRKLQRRLHREQKEKQRNITKAVIAAQERERNEIGKELHDNINQLLATIKLYLELIKKDKKYVDGLLDKSIGFVNEAITDIRRISHVLSYSSMEDLSLFDALKELIHSINLAEKTKIDLSFNIDESKVSSGIKLSIYRIIQEQANNILKYAKARQALIELSQANYSVKLKIQDDGIGFDPCKNKNGIGLCNIESRVMAYSGKLEIHSAPSKGCTLLIEFPLAESR